MCCSRSQQQQNKMKKVLVEKSNYKNSLYYERETELKLIKPKFPVLHLYST